MMNNGHVGVPLHALETLVDAAMEPSNAFAGRGCKLICFRLLLLPEEEADGFGGGELFYTPPKNTLCVDIFDRYILRHCSSMREEK